MKILLVSTVPSPPITSGNRKWIMSQAEFFINAGCDVYFLYVSYKVVLRKNNEADYILEMQRFWGDHLYVYKADLFSRIWLSLNNRFINKFRKGYHTADDNYPPFLGRYVKRINDEHDFDICIVNYYWLTKLFEEVKFRKTGINTHDRFSYKDILGGEKAWMTTTPNEEAKALQRCAYIFALQDSEGCFFRYLSPKSIVLVVYCFYKFYKTPIIGNHNILLLSGNNQYNLNGLRWFLKKVFPKLLKMYPDAKLVLGGSISKCASFMDNPNIIKTGWVDNPIDFFSLGDIFINPTYEGTGLKIKTFESISYNKITIARTHSTEGIFNLNNAPILASDDPEKWLVFISKTWEENGFMKKIKKENESYINKMNQYIEKQYNIILIK